MILDGFRIDPDFGKSSTQLHGTVERAVLTEYFDTPCLSDALCNAQQVIICHAVGDLKDIPAVIGSDCLYRIRYIGIC